MIRVTKQKLRRWTRCTALAIACAALVAPLRADPPAPAPAPAAPPQPPAAAPGPPVVPAPTPKPAVPAPTPLALPVPPAPPPPPVPPPTGLPFQNPDLPIAQRVADLVGRLTLEEKVVQMEMAPPALPRLGLPMYDWWSEGIHGISRAGPATMFPACIGMAATFDVDLIHRVAIAIADEARAKNFQMGPGRYHGLTYWCPTINMARDPRWGRTEECFGEDPWLTARLAVAYVTGLQGNDPNYLKIAATPKHFAIHNQETNRTRVSAYPSKQAIWEYYLPGFRASFVEGKAVSVMTAFNAIDNIPCSANEWLLTDVLRTQWGFDGAVVTDWGAPRHVKGTYGYVDTEEEALALVIKAGVDIPCEPKTVAPVILAAVKKGLLSEKDLDQALTRNFTVRFRLGMFDPPERVPFSQLPASVIGSPKHVALALEVARKAIVLLRNAPVGKGSTGRPLLPLDRTRIESIAVLGPYAAEAQFGTYSAPSANPAVTALDGLTNHLGERTVIRHVPWGKTNNIEPAVKAAMQSDLAIIILGLNHRIEREGVDRQTLDLPKEQQEFIEKIFEANPMTIVVLEGGTPISINWIDENVPAVLDRWYAGEQGGNALADVLFGDVNPSGRLPLTFYKSLDQVPPLDDYDVTKGRTYLYLKDPPLYPFGHGLSYTSFAYGELKVDDTVVSADGSLSVSFELHNTGERDGDEVVQLYVRDVESKAVRPLKQLKAFQRVHLASGETTTVKLSVAAQDLKYWDEASQKMAVEPGAFELMIGASSSDIRLRGAFEVR